MTASEGQKAPAPTRAMAQYDKKIYMQPKPMPTAITSVLSSTFGLAHLLADDWTDFDHFHTAQRLNVTTLRNE